MPIRMVLYGAICLSGLAFADTGRAAEEGPYPIWWSDKLELASLDQVEARLRRDLWLDFPEAQSVEIAIEPLHFLLIRDTPPVGMYVLNMFCMKGSRLWGSRLHRACVV